MNLASEGGDPNSQLLFVNFNQDCTSLAAGTKTGYRLFSLNSVDKLENIYENVSENEDICVVERLFSSSLVALVSLSSPRKLKVCHFKKGTEICNYSYSNTILAVKLNRLRLIVCLEESLYIHNIRDMKVLHTIRDTPPNRTGLCALSIHNDNCYLAYPGSSQVGEVQIFDTANLRAITMIPAHDNPLAAMAFNSQGVRLATASEKGTVIRVFSIPDGQKLFEFRRGVKRCAQIYSMTFSSDSLFLACSSNTETVHVFKLEDHKEKSSEDPLGWMGYFGNALKTSATYLPSQVTEVFKQGRDFAVARLPCPGLKNVCALATIQKMPRLLVAAQDGYLYIYNIDPVEGGECTLLKQHRLDGLQETAVPEGASVAAMTAGRDQPLTSGGSGGHYSPGLGRAGHMTSGDTATPPSGKPLPPSPHLTYASILRRDRQADDDGADNDDDSAACTVEEAMCDADDDCCQEPLTRQEPEKTDNSDAAAHAVEGIRLDDDNEFPPMTHKND